MKYKKLLPICLLGLLLSSCGGFDDDVKSGRIKAEGGYTVLRNVEGKKDTSYINKKEDTSKVTARYVWNSFYFYNTSDVAITLNPSDFSLECGETKLTTALKFLSASTNSGFELIDSDVTRTETKTKVANGGKATHVVTKPTTEITASNINKIRYGIAFDTTSVIDKTVKVSYKGKEIKTFDATKDTKLFFTDDSFKVADNLYIALDTQERSSTKFFDETFEGTIKTTYDIFKQYEGKTYHVVTINLKAEEEDVTVDASKFKIGNLTAKYINPEFKVTASETINKEGVDHLIETISLSGETSTIINSFYSSEVTLAFEGEVKENQKIYYTDYTIN